MRDARVLVDFGLWICDFGLRNNVSWERRRPRRLLFHCMLARTPALPAGILLNPKTQTQNPRSPAYDDYCFAVIAFPFTFRSAAGPWSPWSMSGPVSFSPPGSSL